MASRRRFESIEPTVITVAIEPEQEADFRRTVSVQVATGTEIERLPDDIGDHRILPACRRAVAARRSA